MICDNLVSMKQLWKSQNLAGMFFAIATIGATMTGAQAQQQQPTATKQDLSERLKGYTANAAAIGNFLQTYGKNTKFSPPALPANASAQFLIGARMGAKCVVDSLDKNGVDTREAKAYAAACIGVATNQINEAMKTAPNGPAPQPFVFPQAKTGQPLQAAPVQRVPVGKPLPLTPQR